MLHYVVCLLFGEEVFAENSCLLLEISCVPETKTMSQKTLKCPKDLRGTAESGVNYLWIFHKKSVAALNVALTHFFALCKTPELCLKGAAQINSPCYV